MTRSTFGLLAGAGVIAAVIVACSSDATRGNFGDEKDSGTPPEVTPPPPKNDGSTVDPDSATGDGGNPEGGGEPCTTTPPSNVCGLVPQCGCLNTETCHIDDDKGNVACIAAGKAKMGAPCTGTQGCLRGLTCIFGTCHAFCDAPGTACTAAGTGQCIQVQAGQTAVPNYKVCLVKCDLRDAQSCGGTTAAGTGVCIVDDKGNTDCQEGGSKKELETCVGNGTFEDCGPALVCVSVTSGGNTTQQCRKWCRVGMNADCGGKVCQGFGTKVMVGTVEYGVCST